MDSMRQYDPDPPADDENSKDRPKDDPAVDLFPDDEADERNSKCNGLMEIYFFSYFLMITIFFLFFYQQCHQHQHHNLPSKSMLATKYQHDYVHFTTWSSSMPAKDVMKLQYHFANKHLKILKRHQDTVIQVFSET